MEQTINPSQPLLSCRNAYALNTRRAVLMRKVSAAIDSVVLVKRVPKLSHHLLTSTRLSLVQEKGASLPKSVQ